MEQRVTEQLRLIEETFALAGEAGIELWLRGGWAMDFALGEVTRPHLDIDFFAWAADADALTALLGRHGYEPIEGPDPLTQRDFLKDGVELSLGLLGRDPAGQIVVPAGKYAGAPWPAGMLDGSSGRIGELVCPVISVSAQIEIKEQMPIWVPGMPPREKDRLDVERLRQISRA